MDIDKLTIGELKQLKCLLAGNNQAATNACEEDLGPRIVILQRGWVAVGRYKQKGEYVTLSNASIIRRWGTTEGLPQLALEGKLSNTVLDKSPNIRFHILTEVGSIACDASKWDL